MQDSGKSAEPSMEEILASIRKIIAEEPDNGHGGDEAVTTQPVRERVQDRAPSPAEDGQGAGASSFGRRPRSEAAGAQASQDGVRRAPAASPDDDLADILGQATSGEDRTRSQSGDGMGGVPAGSGEAHQPAAESAPPQFTRKRFPSASPARGEQTVKPREAGAAGGDLDPFGLALPPRPGPASLTDLPTQTREDGSTEVSPSSEGRGASTLAGRLRNYGQDAGAGAAAASPVEPTFPKERPAPASGAMSRADAGQGPAAQGAAGSSREPEQRGEPRSRISPAKAGMTVPQSKPPVEAKRPPESDATAEPGAGADGARGVTTAISAAPAVDPAPKQAPRPAGSGPAPATAPTSADAGVSSALATLAGTPATPKAAQATAEAPKTPKSPTADNSSSVSPDPVDGATSARTLEDAVAEMLRPMLREWLDANLPQIVEKALRAEIAARQPLGGTPTAKRDAQAD